jgi:YidC/Oxa1 family membrane protein insertase
VFQTIFGPISRLFGVILDGIYNGLYSIFGIENLALTIILFTIITRLLMVPLAIKQQKSMKSMQLIQPEIKKIQDKYKNKKDAESQRKMQKELSEVYQKHNANPLSGCLTTLIQLPIILSLFDVLRNIPSYIHSVKSQYLGIISEITKVDNFRVILEEMAEARNLAIASFEPDHLVNFFSHFKLVDWDILMTNFNTVATELEVYITKIAELNYFFGINLSEAPGLAFPGIIIPILAVGAQLLASKTMNMSSTADPATAQTQKTMMYIFPFLSGFFVVAMPSGLGLYWITSSLFQFLQQIYVHKYLDKKEEVK